MPPPRSDFHSRFWLVISISTICIVVTVLTWSYNDKSGVMTPIFVSNDNLSAQIDVKNHSQATAPAIKLSPAQVEFWNYLEQFNRLPENPSKEMIAVYNTKGIAPEFQYLEVSKTSVLGDIKGLTEHRERFVKRYKWVQPLLDKYSIEVPISAERFSGAAKEIGGKYDELMLVSRKCKATPENEKTFVTNYLEGLLVVDFIYACGTPTDKQEGMKVIDGVYRANLLLDPFRKDLEVSFIAPASRDIGWAAIADYPELIWGNTLGFISTGFFHYNPADNVNFKKWILRTKAIRGMQHADTQDTQRGIIHNEQVRIGLISYSIYSAHSHELGRPANDPWLVVIEILFKRLYPTDHAIRYQQYLTLLNAAYPKISS